MTQQNVTGHKTLVISMGILLIVGAVVIGLIWKKNSTDARLAMECPGGHVDLTGRGMVIDSHVDDTIMRVTLEKHPGKVEIVTLDVCSGKSLGTLMLDTDPGMGQE